MKRISQPKLKIFLIVLSAAVLAVWRYFNIPCLFLTLFHRPCPACGMTRAWLSFFHLDIGAAFMYHPMFWSVPILGAYVLFDGELFKSKRLNSGVLIVLGIGFAVSYIIKLVCIS